MQIVYSYANLLTLNHIYFLNTFSYFLIYCYIPAFINDLLVLGKKKQKKTLKSS